jgi:hypothetical protein
MQGWARLDAAPAVFRGVPEGGAAARALALRAWLRRRLKNPPLAAPIDLANFIFGDADIPLLLRAAREAPGEAAAGPDRDEAGGD